MILLALMISVLLMLMVADRLRLCGLRSFQGQVETLHAVLLSSSHIYSIIGKQLACVRASLEEELFL